MTSEEQLVVAGARSLENMSMYANALVRYGKCPCDPGCPNIQVELWRIPTTEDEYSEGEMYCLAYGRGLSLWEAALACHVMMEKVVSDQQEREDEIDALEKLFNESGD